MEDCAWVMEAGMLVQSGGTSPRIVCFVCENAYGRWENATEIEIEMEIVIDVQRIVLFMIWFDH